MSAGNDAQNVRTLEQELRRLGGQVRDADAQKREALVRFAAGFSHDINNFLTPVLAYSSMIKDDLPPGHPAIEYVQEIILAAEKMKQFIKLMQEFRAKGRYGGVIALNKTIMTAIEEFRPRVPANIHLSVQTDPALGDVQGDAAALTRAVCEFLDNAVHAMPVGGDLAVATRGIELNSEVSMDGTAAPPGAYAVVSIRDQGTGMNDDVRTRMYDPYFTGRTPGHSKGLGLSVAYGLIQKCDGHLRCTSALGAGTQIEILLHVLPERAGDEA